MKNNNHFFKIISYTLLVVAFFIGFFNRFAPATFAKPIGNSLDLSAAALGTLAATHFWVYTLMQVPAGLIVDRFGIRLPATLGTLVTGLGAITIGMTSSYIVALSGPFLVGIGMSLVFVAVMKNNAIWFDNQKFGMITGVTLLIGTFGSIASAAPAYFLLKIMDWRAIFIVLGIITIITSFLILLFWRAPDNPNKHKVEVSEQQHITKHRGLWLDVVGSRQLWLILLAISGTNGTFYAFAGLWGSPLLSYGYGLSSASASLILTLALVAYAFSSPIFGQLSDWLKTRKSFIWISSFLNIIAWCWLLLEPTYGFISGLICFLVLGMSSGAQVAVSFAAVKESIHTDLTGSAIAFVNMGVFFITAIVQTAYGWFISLYTTDITQGIIYTSALWFPASLSLIGFAASLFIRETYPNKYVLR